MRRDVDSLSYKERTFGHFLRLCDASRMYVYLWKDEDENGNTGATGCRG